MSKLSVSLACGPYDRTAALLDGTVRIDGCDVNAHALSPEESFFRSFRHAEFDISELSFSTYLIKTARGECPYIAIPAFVSRSFRHSAIYVRKDSGIERAEDLKGRRIGVPEYQVTAAVWVRHLLEVDHGVAPSMVEWFTGGVEEPGRHEKTALNLSPDIRISAIKEGQTLNEMLLSGEIDALVCPRAPASYKGQEGDIRRLFGDPVAAAIKYYKRHKAFPIMHVIGIRKTLVEANPWLPVSVMKAFTKARDIALKKLEDTTALAVSLPWLVEEAERSTEVFGGNFWSYGTENEAAIDVFLDTHHRQGLSSRRLQQAEIFAPSSMERYKI
jgi:4,5-dihydroxyphthalate decarboxylase